MLTRAISGIVFVAIVIGAIMWHHLSFVALLIFVNAVGQYELFKNVQDQGKAKLHGMGATMVLVSSGVVLMYSNTLFSGQSRAFFFLIPVILFAMFLRFVFQQMEDGLKTMAYICLGLVYITLPMLMLQHWAAIEGEYRYTYLIGGLVLIWTNDVFAYLTGKFLGRHKMIERVSPKKTWEGTIGGFLFAIAAAFIYAYVTDQPMLPWAGFGLLCGLCATLGDLVESVIKRSLGVKDMGNLMPGHGGVLDRFDALIFAAPFGAAYVQLVFV